MVISRQWMHSADEGPQHPTHVLLHGSHMVLVFDARQKSLVHLSLQTPSSSTYLHSKQASQLFRWFDDERHLLHIGWHGRQASRFCNGNDTCLHIPFQPDNMDLFIMQVVGLDGLMDGQMNRQTEIGNSIQNHENVNKLEDCIASYTYRQKEGLWRIRSSTTPLN